MSPRPTSIADRIRWAIRSRGLTQAAFAVRAQMASSQLSVLLSRLDERPLAVELETVLRLAQAGSVQPRWLLLGEGNASERDEKTDEPSHPALRKNPEFGKHIVELRHRGFVIPDDLAAWVGEVALPLERLDELSTEVMAALVRMRLQMQYGRALEPLENTSFTPAVTGRAPARSPIAKARRKPSAHTRSKKPSR